MPGALLFENNLPGPAELVQCQEYLIPGQARAAETALEQNIMPYSGSPEMALNRAQNLRSKTGRGIEEVLKKTPINPLTAIDNVNSLRWELTKGMPGGDFSGATNVIDDVVTDLKTLFDQSKGSYGFVPKAPTTTYANTVNAIKKRLGDKINYLSDLASQSDNKALVNKLANTIRDAVKSFTTPEEFANFLNNQNLYSAAKLMIKGLNNEVAAQQGNKAMRLFSVIPAAGQIAAKNIPGAAATLGLMEARIRRII